MKVSVGVDRAVMQSNPTSPARFRSSESFSASGLVVWHTVSSPTANCKDAGSCCVKSEGRKRDNVAKLSSSPAKRRFLGLPGRPEALVMHCAPRCWQRAQGVVLDGGRRHRTRFARHWSQADRLTDTLDIGDLIKATQTVLGDNNCLEEEEI